ncbi:type II secretion system protein [Mesobacillus jeotgali]|uniref:type II secretion system protein n=1 Tax=Mesobacillus jeotgali TaxID=129985 RepID=UPI001CFF2643|nr:type II secretion system protein [Mesobacillus jeotgali]
MLKAMKKKMKDQRGLTLVELLAVIVILGIIAAIAVPSIGNIIDNTEEKATVAEGLQIINAAKLYVAENPTATTITPQQLDGYLEKISTTDTSDFTSVTVSKSSTGKYTYTLNGHDSVPLANDAENATSVSEQQLLDY